MAIILSVLVILFLYEVITTNAQECGNLPSDRTIEGNLQVLLIAAGDIFSDPNLLKVMYTCMAQGMTMGSYREISVIVTYNNVANSPQSRQFDMQCLPSNAGWLAKSGSLDSAPPGFESLETRTNCSQCSRDANNDHDCVGKGILPLYIMFSFYQTVACHPNCTYGLMRCTGDDSDECCPFFEDGVCTTSCSQNNHVANEQNNYICCKNYVLDCSSINSKIIFIYLFIWLSMYPSKYLFHSL